MKIDWPEGVEGIVRAVRGEVKQKKVLGPSPDNEENAAWEIIRCIRDRGTLKRDGLDPNETPSKRDWHKANREAMEWAAKEYFKLRLIDLRRNHLSHHLELFLDHEVCELPPHPLTGA
jgi:hypothetical protein